MEQTSAEKQLLLRGEWAKSEAGRKLRWELFSSLMLLCVDKRVRRRGSSLARAAVPSSSRSFCLTEYDLPAWRLEWRTSAKHMAQWCSRARGSDTCEAAATIRSSEAAFWLNWAQFSIPYVQSISSISVSLAPLGSFFSIKKKKEKRKVKERKKEGNKQRKAKQSKTKNTQKIKTTQTPTHYTQIFCFWNPLHLPLKDWHILTCRGSTALICFWLMQVLSFLGLNPITLNKVLR